MKKIWIVFAVVLIQMYSRAYGQSWDKNSIEKRRFEICYKVCKGEELSSDDFTDLFEKGLLEILVKNVKSDKDVYQIEKIIEGSNKYFMHSCDLYQAIADSVYKSCINRNKADSIVVHQ
jgi:hypothetical protein